MKRSLYFLFNIGRGRLLSSRPRGPMNNRRPEEKQHKAYPRTEHFSQQVEHFKPPQQASTAVFAVVLNTPRNIILEIEW